MSLKYEKHLKKTEKKIGREMNLFQGGKLYTGVFNSEN